ncbi:peptidase S8/S53 domain-containing protein [Obelidium mucronatum]|nr:peptidase S8/S53 domain-containing protein [Obelidium mucronatum]
MKLTTIIKSLILAACTAAQPVRRGAPDGAPNTIECTYIVNFPLGTDGPAAIKKHFDGLGVTYSTRTVVNTKLANFVSFSIHGGCNAKSQVGTIAAATHYSTVRDVPRAKPVKIAPGEVGTAPELIHSITGVNDARKYLKVTGKGINVAVIDSGVYYLHPALGGGFGPGFKVSKGYDFVGDAFGDNSLYVPVPDADPIDNCSESSHGTHVAGIVAADARNITVGGFIPSIPFTGVAPEANIFAYRVFGCTGGTGVDIMAAAIYRAADDGAHIMNLSIGGGPNYADEEDNIAADIVGKNGHFVFGSAGNNGANGPNQVGGSGISLGSVSVASFDNVAAPSSYLTVDGVQFTYGTGNNGSFTENQVLDIVVNNINADDQDIQDDGTAAVPTLNAKGKALLIRWGDRTKGGSAVRCGYAFRAGAVACVLYNNGLANVNIAGSPDVASMIIPHEAGQAIIADIKAGKVPKVVVSLKKIFTPIPTAATLSDFSSPGLDNELYIKPDLGGVGGQVWSTISPFAAQGHECYGSLSGTSMSAPYVAGVAALVYQARGKIPFAEFKGYLQNTASLKPIYGTNMTHSPAYQGAGLINAYGAVGSKTLVLPSSISLNDTDNHLKTATITIRNSNKFAMTYHLNNKETASVNYLLPGDDFTMDQKRTNFTDKTPATLKFDGQDGWGSEAWDYKMVRVPAGKSVTVTFKVTPPKVDPTLHTVYGGFVKIVNDYDDEVITIPYAGVVGSFKKRNIWSRKSPSLTGWLANSVGLNISTAATGVYNDLLNTPISANSIINATEGALVLTVVATTSRNGSVRAIYQGADLSEIKKLGFTGDDAIASFSSAGDTHILSNSVIQRTTFASVDWDIWLGYAAPSDQSGIRQLPSGPYKIVFKALRGFGRAGVDADYDVISTETFNLVY